MKKIFIAILLCLPLYMSSQQLISTAGAESRGIVWSVGEIMTATLKNNDSSVFVMQGLLQPGYFGTTGIINNVKALTVEAYPNPVIDKLYINLKNQESTTQWKLYNITGTLIEQGQSSLNTTFTIDFSNYSKGHYILMLKTESENHSIKIIK